MPIVSKIGRKAWPVRLLVGLIYVLLTAGSLTMIYPFLLMVAGSTKSGVDTPENRVIPSFLTDDAALYRKHIEGFFNESMELTRSSYHIDMTAFANIDPPPAPNAALAGEWRSFLEDADLPLEAFMSSYVSVTVSRGTIPSGTRAFKRELATRFDGDIARLNAEFGTKIEDWSALYVRYQDFLLRRNTSGRGPFDEAYRMFKSRRPIEQRVFFSPEGFYKWGFLKSQYTRDIDAYNEAHDTEYASWDDVHFDRRLPAGAGRTDQERADWLIFARTILNMLWIRAEAGAAPHYQAFLEAKYGTIDVLNRNYEANYGAFADVPLVSEPPSHGLPLSDWDAFLQGWQDPDTKIMHMLPDEMIRIHSVELLFRDHLAAKYGSIENANAALGTAYARWEEVIPPQRDMHYLEFERRKRALRWEFVGRNYASVFDYIVLHGRGVLNTAIYCILQILCALSVNPLAAYALSRYKPPSAYKVLLFLMLTMAFPPMVTQIPSFLMLREFGLLNTFWALILPGMANGYSIFLLKGFFDSLPQELYESAELDGAGEFRIFFTITMSLSTPILAVIALRAFTIAYSNFMMALLICQDKKMWTLMPWLYQLQQRSAQGVIYSSLLIAAIPTFVVFVFCQNVIMRGIVVPVEK